MALVIRARYIPRSTPPCYKCQDRTVGCHSNCQKHDEWKREDVKRKREFKKRNADIARIESYVIGQKTKNAKARTKQWKGMKTM